MSRSLKCELERATIAASPIWVGRWRSVNLELPDDDATVLISTTSRIAAYVLWEEPVWVGYIEGGVWHSADGQKIESAITPTHWMPLPEPPQAN